MARPADGSTGAVPALDVDELLASVPGLDKVDVELRTIAFRSLPGASVGFDDLTALTELITAEIDAGARGVVVTQGTDTIEETAFFLDTSVLDGAPVVVTGAMRNPSLAGADGPANLLAAVHVAAAPTSRGLGTLVVMADQVHAARRVRKAHTTSTAAFTSPDTGPIGYVVEGRVRYLARPGERTWIGLGDTLP